MSLQDFTKYPTDFLRVLYILELLAFKYMFKISIIFKICEVHKK